MEQSYAVCFSDGKDSMLALDRAGCASAFTEGSIPCASPSRFSHGAHEQQQPRAK